MSPARQAGGMSRALLSAALFGAAAPLTKELLATLPANLLAGLLYLGAGLFVLPALLHRRRDAPGLPRDRRNRLRLAGATFFGGVAGPLLLLSGLSVARAASVSLWLNLEVVATAVVAARFFHEQVGRWTWLGNLAMVVAGVLLGFEGGRSGLLGCGLVTAAALCWGLDNNLTAVIDGMSPLAITFWKCLVAGAVNLLAGLALWPVPPPGREWLFAVVVGGLSYGLSIWLYISAAQMLGAARSQTLFATAPFFGVLVAIAWLGERLSQLQVLAGLLVLGAIVLLQLDRHGHPHRHEATVHSHEHRHDDGHHDHSHPGLAPSLRHSHEHAHAELAHSHPHWPDLHHRHVHP